MHFRPVLFFNLVRNVEKLLITWSVYKININLETRQTPIIEIRSYMLFDFDEFDRIAFATCLNIHKNKNYFESFCKLKMILFFV